MKKVYISATYNDLKEHRASVAHALRKMGYEVRCMEDYVATDERTDARCTQDVSTCDFYVGIIAQRYGWILPGAIAQSPSWNIGKRAIIHTKPAA